MNVPWENRYEVLVGVNSAVSAICPVATNDVVVAATPLAFTATAEPMFVPLASNWTVPAGFVPSAADVSAVSVTVVPAFAGFGDAVRVAVVATGDVPAMAAEAGTQATARPTAAASVTMNPARARRLFPPRPSPRRAHARTRRAITRPTAESPRSSRRRAARDRTGLC